MSNANSKLDIPALSSADSTLGHELLDVSDSRELSLNIKTTHEYRCCCGQLHVYTVAKWLVVYHLMLFIFLVAVLFHESVELSYPILLLFGVTGWALFRTQAEWLWPFIIYTIVSTGMSIFFSAYLFFYYTIKNQEPVEQIVMLSVEGDSVKSHHILLVVPHVFNLLLFSFHCWQIVILLETRRFFKRIKLVKKQLLQQDSISVQTATSHDTD